MCADTSHAPRTAAILPPLQQRSPATALQHRYRTRQSCNSVRGRRVPCDPVLLPATDVGGGSRTGAGRSDTDIGQFVRQPAEYIVPLCDLILKMIYLKCWRHDLSIAPQLRLYRAADCIEWKTLIFVIGPAGRLAAAAQWILFVKSARAALAAWPPVLECRVRVSGAGGCCSTPTHNSF